MKYCRTRSVGLLGNTTRSILPIRETSSSSVALIVQFRVLGAIGYGNRGFQSEAGVGLTTPCRPAGDLLALSGNRNSAYIAAQVQGSDN